MSILEVHAIVIGRTPSIEERQTFMDYGDFNGDGSIDVRELSTFARALGSTPSDLNWNPVCDFNKDNVIDLIDLNTMLSRMNTNIMQYLGETYREVTARVSISGFGRGAMTPATFTMGYGTYAIHVEYRGQVTEFEVDYNFDGSTQAIICFTPFGMPVLSLNTVAMVTIPIAVISAIGGISYAIKR
jgi:hypothetical protein